MHSSVVVLLLVLALSSVRADLIPEIIYSANVENLKNHKDVIQIPEYTYETLPFKLHVKNGHAMNFSSLALRGDNQVLNQTDLESGDSKLDFDITVGLDYLSLEVEFDYSLLYFLKGLGKLQVNIPTNAVRAKGFIISRGDGSCDATLESAEITEIKDLKIEVTPLSSLEAVINPVVNFFVPRYKSTFNEKIQNIVKNKVPGSDFSKIVCKPLAIDV